MLLSRERTQFRQRRTSSFTTSGPRLSFAKHVTDNSGPKEAVVIVFYGSYDCLSKLVDLYINYQQQQQTTTSFLLACSKTQRCWVLFRQDECLSGSDLKATQILCAFWNSKGKMIDSTTSNTVDYASTAKINDLVLI
jgi:hypothetical protein